MKAEVEVPALEVVLMELRQFPEAIELALEATGRPERPLRVLLGDTARSEERFSPKFQLLKVFELADNPFPADLVVGLGGVGEPRPRRPLAQVDDASSSTLLTRPAAGLGVGALRPMMRLVTLLAVADIGCA